MGSGRMIIDEIKKELLEAENILNTEFSFELAEPNYIRCIELINANSDIKDDVEALIISMFEDKAVSSEPIAYLMYCLRWPRVKTWMEESLRNTPDAIATGAPMEKVIDAYDDDWENKEFYKSI
ncbi:hypothetical protein [Aliikangiella maris]|uniref:Uncharacterized protein n=2 Tax=Aliikangiella maris TaxID=3162458 RepID=A0ABV2BXI5_9GAMM